MNEWIKVEDKLPENDRYVITLINTHPGDKIITLGYHSQRTGWRILENNYQYSFFTITHWHDLPKLPKDI